jgi:hypothetical protein
MPNANLYGIIMQASTCMQKGERFGANGGRNAGKILAATALLMKKLRRHNPHTS